MNKINLFLQKCQELTGRKVTNSTCNITIRKITFPLGVSYIDKKPYNW